jgi:hypothetical protein
MTTFAERNDPAAGLPAGPSSCTDLEAERRRLKVRLLRDLVSNGLYRVRMDELVDRLLPHVSE